MSSNDDEELLVFGYGCKLFRDDEKALQLEQGSGLVAWMGDERLRIDRFDGRGCLHDLSTFEAKPSRQTVLTEEEIDLEKQLDNERYADLVLASEASADDKHEEELKRFREEMGSDATPYNQVNFSYTEQPKETSPEKPEEPTFSPPASLDVPDSMEKPKVEKEHQLIEKTALFISKNGPQMEIVIKTKQSSNEQFHFMNVDSPLYPYYKLVLSAIKSGSYIPVSETSTSQSKDEDSDSDSDSDDEGGGYLHPSLLAGKAKPAPSFLPPPMPVLPLQSTSDTAYSQLVQSLKGKVPMVEQKSAQKEQNAVQSGVTTAPPASSESKHQATKSLLPPPPPEIEIIIEKLASYVAKSGEELEAQVRKRGEERFSFLFPGHPHHAHYIRRKLHYIGEERKRIAEAKALEEKSKKKEAISFSLARDKSRKIRNDNSDDEIWSSNKNSSRSPENRGPDNDDALANKLAAAAKGDIARDKKLQEERKRRMQLFLSVIKSKQQGEGSDDGSGAGVYGPALPDISTPAVPLTTVADRAEQNSKSESLNAKTNKATTWIPFVRPDSSYSSESKSDRKSHHKSSRRSRSRSPPSPKRSKSSHRYHSDSRR